MSRVRSCAVAAGGGECFYCPHSQGDHKAVAEYHITMGQEMDFH